MFDAGAVVRYAVVVFPPRTEDVDALEGVYRSMASYPGGKITAAMQYSASLSPLQVT